MTCEKTTDIMNASREILQCNGKAKQRKEN